MPASAPFEETSPWLETPEDLQPTLENDLHADVVVIGCPMYNFGPPAALKAWADLVARAGHTFEYGEQGPAGTVGDRPTYIVTASGGAPVGGPVDFASNWLTVFLGFLGITSVTTVAASAIMSDPDGVMGAAHAQVQELIAAS